MPNRNDLADAMSSEFMPTLQAAIDKSRLQNEIVHVTIETACDISTIVAFLDDQSDNIDSVRESDGSFDVWGWSDAMEQAGNGDMEWRLGLTIVAPVDTTQG